jgi:hypothetical protein
VWFCRFSVMLSGLAPSVLILCLNRDFRGLSAIQSAEVLVCYPFLAACTVQAIN